jgi:pyruvate,water dikinase
MKSLIALTGSRQPAEIGGKAARLHWLRRHGFAIPETFVCPWRTHTLYLADPSAARRSVEAALAPVIRPATLYAVRSSADVEDETAHSFAGQFTTVLRTQGLQAVVDAVQTVWDAARAPGVEAYRRGRAAPPVRMAVIVQEMIEPVVAGLAFSRHPLTGMDEVVVEATRGSAETLASGGDDPLRWVYKWGAWLAQPTAAVDLQSIVEQVVAGTRAIAAAYGAPVDLEWAFDGHRLYWLQLRPMAPARPIPVYSNHIARGMLPGIILPLVWSFNIPLVNGAWVRVFTEMIGPNDIRPEELARSFAYRAYFNMAAVGRVFELVGMPRESLELLMGLGGRGAERPRFRPSARTYRLLPRLLRFAAGKWRFGAQIGRALPALRRQIEALRAADLPAKEGTAFLAHVDRLFTTVQEVAYFNIVTPLLMHVYDRLLAAALARSGMTPADLDMTAGLAELDRLDPNRGLVRLRTLAAALPPAARAAAEQGDLAALAGAPGGAAFGAELAQFLAQFGHLSDNGNNFAAVPWRETPDLVLRLAAQPVDPAPPARRQTYAHLRVPLLRRPWLNLVYGRARQFRLHREEISSLYTLGYGLCRDAFLALAQRLVALERLATADDIFYLTWAEVRELTQGAMTDAAGRIALRRQEAQVAQDISPPAVIYGDAPLPLMQPAGHLLHGVPVAAGSFRGRARAVRGLGDITNLAQGEALLIPYADIGWAPLFQRAGAVVSESGGLLSHAAIVAREYGIPAVVSVEGACRLADGWEVTVNGDRGEVILHDGPAGEAAP